MRTAVLVVHGMGSQRPLETVRGVIDAVWFACGVPDPAPKPEDRIEDQPREIWSHPEASGADIDLTVMTTSGLKTASGETRSIDFHELYWAHLMSETRAVAVLLWLLELARRGPNVTTAIKPLYYVAVIFLSLLALSISLLALQGITWFAGQVPPVRPEAAFDGSTEVHALTLILLLALGVAALASALAALAKGAGRLVALTGIVAIFCVGLFYATYKLGPDGGIEVQDRPEILSNLLLPVMVALVLVYVTMGYRGVAGLAYALFLSYAAFFLACWLRDTSFMDAYYAGWTPWTVKSYWSALGAIVFIALYSAIAAVFLQPYLGDAARYFRASPGNTAVRREIRKQAVDTLAELHECGRYDRIVVVAHSLGTVVAYDMLRAYYSRVQSSFPPVAEVSNALAAVSGHPDAFKALDDGNVNEETARKLGRTVIAVIADLAASARKRREEARSKGQPVDAADERMKSWLVTDFVTMGSPLTHARYLMCNGSTVGDLQKDFNRRTREREFPTCPPRKLDKDGWLTYENPTAGHAREFHHGGQFALTRWTNLYFPAHELLWGDAVGGPVKNIFGAPKEADQPARSHIADVEVYVGTPDLPKPPITRFAHVLYWSRCKIGNRVSQHIRALERAVDLEDRALESRARQP
ncbi:MAG TPA: hypothetical protein VNR39_04855 [Pseudolabrys sp.]|nr:hypothetical protein [Pseudolabrys sp.]